MIKQQTYSDFKQIVLNDIPLIDVRAPIEYEKGSFINAVNIPIMDDEQRRQVGICYKEQGNEKATELGYSLVSGKIKEELVEKWVDFLNQNPNAMIFCFRGGSRSKIAQQWIFEATGKNVLRLCGGYKAFRNYLISELEPQKMTSKVLRLGGCTGSGKTILLNKLENQIDLEGIANHRGSSFGVHVTKQPTQIGFENNLAYAIIKHREKKFEYMIIEDEGKNVGANFLPKPLAVHFNNSDLIVLEISLEERVDITRYEYVNMSQSEFSKVYGDECGVETWAQYIRQSLDRIKKRLGLERYKEILELFEKAYKQQLSTDTFECHNEWISILLEKYYDSMYLYQIKKQKDKIIFSGDKQQVYEFLSKKK